MIKFFCDRCDTEVEKALIRITIPRINTVANTLEICERCLDDIIECAKPLPKVKSAR